jgi:hypothetical protein
MEAVVVEAFLAHLGADTMSALLANPRAFARELQRRTEVEARMSSPRCTSPATSAVSNGPSLAQRWPSASLHCRLIRRT